METSHPTATGKGTWTPDEHDRFLQAMKLFPRGPWKAITDCVGTRSIRQTQTHAQKYQEKLRRLERGLLRKKRIVTRPHHRIDASVVIGGGATTPVDGRHHRRRRVHMKSAKTPAKRHAPTDMRAAECSRVLVMSTPPPVQAVEPPTLDILLHQDDETSDDEDDDDFGDAPAAGTFDGGAGGGGEVEQQDLPTLDEAIDFFFYLLTYGEQLMMPVCTEGRS